jgi:hypothetical protein
MSTYLLTCECGKTIPVEVGQAGERVACECGVQLEVPTLRKLRHLPVAEPLAVKPRATWNARKGLVSASLIASAVLFIAAAWSRWTEPSIPEFKPENQLHVVDTELAKITPAEAWQRWVAFYQPLAKRGFTPLEYPFAAAIEQKIAERRFLQKVLLSIAVVWAAIALIVALWPRPKPGRR